MESKSVGISNLTVMTAHGLAYQNVVKGSNYKVRSSFTVMDVIDLLDLTEFYELSASLAEDERITDLEFATFVLNVFNSLCYSRCFSINDEDFRRSIRDEYTKKLGIGVFDNYSDLMYRCVLSIWKQMKSGSVPVTHDFYLKLYQVSKPVLRFDAILLDECIPGNYFVDTDKGRRRIDSVYNSLTRGEVVHVKSFNSSLGSFEFKRALNPLKSDGRTVLEIETEGLTRIRCTPNHKLLTLRGYVDAGCLERGVDVILHDNPCASKTKYLLNDDQYQLVLASYLGDGSVDTRSDLGTYRVRFTQGEDYKSYFDWKCAGLEIDLFSVVNSGYNTSKQVYSSAYSRTFYLGRGDLFKKALTDISPLGLAIWFMDDGSRRQLHTEGFSYEQNLEIRDMLISKFGFETDVRESRGYYYLSFKKDAERVLFNLVKDYLRPEFLYKFSDDLVIDFIPSDFQLNSSFSFCGANVVKSIKLVEGVYDVYDFEVEGLHNFVVYNGYNSKSGMIVHNCQDSNDVMLDIIERQDCIKGFVGDACQQIYGFRDAVNAFEKIDHKSFNLSNSFRFGEDIANLANKVLSWRDKLGATDTVNVTGLVRA